jgi:hypothetical protein
VSQREGHLGATAAEAPPWQSWSVRTLMLLVWVSALWFLLGHSYCLYDDAYIYFRFVENMFNGCPLAYNCADGPVEGFTSPLFFILLTVGRVFTRDLESVSQLLGVLFIGMAMTVAVLTAASPRFDRVGQFPFVPVVRAAGVALVLGLDHFLLLHSVIGLETGLAALWGALMLWSCTGQQRPWLRTLAIAGIFVRPEFVLFIFLLPAFVPEARKVRYWVPFVVAGALTVGTRLVLFGDFLPNTFWAKSGGTADHARLGWLYIRDALTDYPTALFAPLALFFQSGRRMVGYYLMVALVWTLFFLRSGGDFFSYGRMFVPLVPGLTVLATLGLFAALDRLPIGWKQWSIAGPVVAGFLLLVPALWADSEHAIPEQHGMVRVGRWTQVGKYLGNVHPGATVAATPVGAIGYFSGARILDLVGLVDRTVAKEGSRIPDLSSRGKIGHERVHTEYILSQQPDIIVIDLWKREPFARGDRINSQFHGERELMDAIRSGKAPYVPYVPKVGPDLYWFMYMRVADGEKRLTD